MTYTIRNFRNDCIKRVFQRDLHPNELSGLEALLKFDTDLPNTEFLTRFRALKNDCQLIRDLCQHRDGFLNGLAYNLRLPSYKADRFKNILNQLKTGKGSDDISYFTHATTKYSICQKVEALKNEYLTKCYGPDQENEMWRDERNFTELDGFNKNLDFKSYRTMDNVSNKSDNDPEIWNQFVTVEHPEYGCITPDNQNNSSLININGRAIKELKKEIMQSFRLPEDQDLFNENGDLNPSVGIAIKHVDVEIKEQRQPYINSAIKIQAIVRGGLVRKRNLQPEDSTKDTPPAIRDSSQNVIGYKIDGKLKRKPDLVPEVCTVQLMSILNFDKKVSRPEGNEIYYDKTLETLYTYGQGKTTKYRLNRDKPHKELEDFVSKLENNETIQHATLAHLFEDYVPLTEYASYSSGVDKRLTHRTPKRLHDWLVPQVGLTLNDSAQNDYKQLDQDVLDVVNQCKRIIPQTRVNKNLMISNDLGNENLLEQIFISKSYEFKLDHFKQIAADVDFYLSHDIVHRDIKPGNMMLHKNEIYLIDLVPNMGKIGKFTGRFDTKKFAPKLNLFLRHNPNFNNNTRLAKKHEKFLFIYAMMICFLKRMPNLGGSDNNKSIDIDDRLYFTNKAGFPSKIIKKVRCFLDDPINYDIDKLSDLF